MATKRRLQNQAAELVGECDGRLKEEKEKLQAHAATALETVRAQCRAGEAERGKLQQTNDMLSAALGEAKARVAENESQVTRAQAALEAKERETGPLLEHMRTKYEASRVEVAQMRAERANERAARQTEAAEHAQSVAAAEAAVQEARERAQRAETVRAAARGADV